MKCRMKDILPLPSLGNATLVAGQSGLDRELRWLHIVDVVADALEIFRWTQGGELLVMSGSRGDNSAALLPDMVRQVQEHGLAGILIVFGMYIDRIPEEAVLLADALGVPLLTLPWEVPLVNVTQDICTLIVQAGQEQENVRQLLETLFFKEPGDPALLLQQLQFHGVNQNRAHLVVVADLDDFSDFLRNSGLTSEEGVMTLKQRFYRIVSAQMDAVFGRRALSMTLSDAVILLLPVGDEFQNPLIQFCDALRVQVAEKLPGLTVSLGIGTPRLSPAEFRISLEEAEKALKIRRALHRKGQVLRYAELGIPMLLLEMKDSTLLRHIRENTLAPLHRHDKANEGSLAETLLLYLTHGENIQTAAEALFIHRNTLKYRLRRIEEVCECNLDNPETRFRFRLAFHIREILGD